MLWSVDMNAHFVVELGGPIYLALSVVRGTVPTPRRMDSFHQDPHRIRHRNRTLLQCRPEWRSDGLSKAPGKRDIHSILRLGSLTHHRPRLTVRSSFPRCTCLCLIAQPSYGSSVRCLSRPGHVRLIVPKYRFLAGPHQLIGQQDSPSPGE